MSSSIPPTLQDRDGARLVLDRRTRCLFPWWSRSSSATKCTNSSECLQARLPVIDLPRLVECDQHIMVDVVWIGIFDGPLLSQVHRAFDPPRPSPNEAFTRHCCK